MSEGHVHAEPESGAFAAAPLALTDLAIEHFRTVMSTGTVPTKLKELCVVRVSQLNNCDY